MSTLGKVDFAKQNSALSCFMVVYLGSWSLVSIPTEKTTKCLLVGIKWASSQSCEPSSGSGRPLYRTDSLSLLPNSYIFFSINVHLSVRFSCICLFQNCTLLFLVVANNFFIVSMWLCLRALLMLTDKTTFCTLFVCFFLSAHGSTVLTNKPY